MKNETSKYPCDTCSYSEDCTDNEKELCASHDYEYYDEECDHDD